MNRGIFPERHNREQPAEPYGPVTLYHMSLLFDDYRLAVLLAAHNRAGRNPRYPGKAGENLGTALAAKADCLAIQFPQFPETLKKTER